MYAYRMLGGRVDKKCKGTKKCVVKKRITFDDYKEVYETGKIQYRTQQRFVSEKHRVYMQSVRKVALSADMTREYKLGIKHGLMEL